MTSIGLTFKALLAISLLAASGCRERSPDAVRVEVRSVGFDVASDSPVVVLEDRERQVALPIWVGNDEARAIALELEGIHPPRPLTHDLFKATLDRAGVEFDRVEIGNLEQSTYFATIHLRNADGDFQMDSRPSDAIALAMRFERPIYVAAVLMSGSTVVAIDKIKPSSRSRSSEVAGISVQALSPELAEYFGLPAGQGVIVTELSAQAPLGLARGDIILKVDEKPVTSPHQLRQSLQSGAAQVGRRLHVRRDDRDLTVELTPPKG